MKTTFQKYAFVIFTAIGISSAGSVLFSQSIEITSGRIQAVQNKNTHFCRDTSAEITLFTGMLTEETIYLHWNAAGQKSNGLYIIYRSSNGESYDVIGYKKGTGVPIQSEIAYYFADESPCPGTNFYGIVHIGCNQTFLASEIISIQNTNQVFSYKATLAPCNSNVTPDK